MDIRKYMAIVLISNGAPGDCTYTAVQIWATIVKKFPLTMMSATDGAGKRFDNPKRI
jgi:hypothetical protein